MQKCHKQYCTHTIIFLIKSIKNLKIRHLDWRWTILARSLKIKSINITQNIHFFSTWATNPIWICMYKLDLYLELYFRYKSILDLYAICIVYKSGFVHTNPNWICSPKKAVTRYYTWPQIWDAKWKVLWTIQCESRHEIDHYYLCLKWENSVYICNNRRMCLWYEKAKFMKMQAML